MTDALNSLLFVLVVGAIALALVADLAALVGWLRRRRLRLRPGERR